MTTEYSAGLRRGLPVGMGYFSVSFGFGAMAVSQGVRAWEAALISLTNLTSAGQFAGLTVIVAAAGLWELVLTQLIINSRYALLAMALSCCFAWIPALARISQGLAIVVCTVAAAAVCAAAFPVDEEAAQ